MQRIFTAAALAAGLALALPAGAQAQRGDAHPSVRNESSQTLSCRIQWRGRARYDRIVLRPAETWRPAAGSRRARSIYCDPPAASVRYRLEPGQAYRLVREARSVRIVLRPR